MCTAISFSAKDHYFGRNLDLYYGYDEKITITPRNFPLRFRMIGGSNNHFALIGMATICDGYPLYYEATNEKGLSAAALNFPHNCTYFDPISTKENIASFEVILWLLMDCATVKMAEEKLKKINITNTPFNKQFPPSPLHWLISDKEKSIVLEQGARGIRLYQNSIGVLTNNPPFDVQMLLLQNYIQLSPKMPENRFGKTILNMPYSLGLGAMGLPGDLSSPSRFVRGAFGVLNSVCDDNEGAALSQFFHILDFTSQTKGLVETQKGELEYTRYSCCVNTNKGVYYYKTYENFALTAVDMWREDLEKNSLITYPLLNQPKIAFQN